MDRDDTPRQPANWQTLRLEGADSTVCTLWLSRPERRNAMSHQLVQELVECLSLLRERRTLRVLILGVCLAAPIR